MNIEGMGLAVYNQRVNTVVGSEEVIEPGAFDEVISGMFFIY